MSAAEMREALKPCPFCGGEAKVKYWNGGWIDACYRVECVDWKCPGKTSFGSQSIAASAWNRRPLPSDDKMVERVARAIASVYGLDDFAPFYEDARAALRAINGGKP